MPSATVAKDSYSDMQRMQQQAEWQRREAERQRREAEQRRREAERRRREAERQRREAERQRQIAERQKQQQQQQRQQQQSAKSPPQTTSNAPSKPQATQSSSKTTSKTASSSKTEKSEKAEPGSKNKTENDKTSNDARTAEAADSEETAEISDDLSLPPSTMQELFKRWMAPPKPARQSAHHRHHQAVHRAQEHRKEMRRKLADKKKNQALKPWTANTKAQKSEPAANAVSKAVAQTEPAAAKPAATGPAAKLVKDPRPPRPEPKKASPGQAKSDETETAASSASVGQPPPLDIGMPPAPELLAVDASPETVKRARGLGFGIGRASKFSKLKFSVTRLVAPKGMSAAQAKALLKRKFPAVSVEPNRKYRIYKTATGTNETGKPNAGLLKSLQSGNCTSEHCFPSKIIRWKPALNRCAKNTKIGIIDTSVDLTHPAFYKKKLTVSHFGKKDPPAPDWHGTGVTAILAGDAKSGTPGLIPDANFYLADVFHADEDGNPTSDTVSMLRAFDWLEAKGVKIINMSLSGPRDELIKQAIAKLSAKGIVLVAAAGNEGPIAAPSYPAAYDDVIAVTAVNENLRSYRYANRGSYIDVAAPGVGIWTALPGARQGFHSGTSFATPYITATLATLMSRHPNARASNLMKKLDYQDLGDPGPDPVYGQGLVQAPKSCGGDAVAQAVVREPGSTRQTPSFAPASAGSAPEVLPWLSFQD